MVFFAGQRGRFVNQDELDAKEEEEKGEGKKKTGKMFCHRQPQRTFVKLTKLNLAKLKPKGEGRGNEERREGALPASTSTNLKTKTKA